MPPVPPAEPFARDLLAFISASPSPFHAVAEAARRLDAAGFVRLAERDDWSARVGPRYLVRGGSLVAWVTGPEHGPTTAFGVVGAHTDSPNLRVKPQPDTGRVGWRQLGVEVYGGVLLNSWLDRDLGLSGRVVVRDATADEGIATRLVHVDRPLLRIPQLAIHLDRNVNTSGLELNPQAHLAPVWGTGPVDEGGFARFLAEEVGVAPGEVLSWEAMLHDLTPPTALGLDGSLLAAPRIDNLLSCHSAIEAVAGAVSGPRPVVPVVCLFDHEEVGSQSATGADSSILPTVLERITAILGGHRDEWHRALAGSWCVSTDGAHATHPNYAERHEPDHLVAIGGGPVLKVNANVRYATDAPGAARVVVAAERAGVPLQRFVTRTDMPCGSTIGPVTAARLGIPTVDVGVAQLSMHSARELCGASDPARLHRLLTALLTG